MNYKMLRIALGTLAWFLSSLATAEITDLRVEDPRNLPTNVYAFGCPVTSDQLEAVLNARLERRGVNSIKPRDYNFGYSAGAICRKQGADGHIFIIQLMFLKTIEGDVRVAFAEQGYQVNAGVGGADELLEAFAGSLRYSLHDYFRQNIWD